MEATLKLKNIYDSGKDAFCNGKTEESCPYRNGIKLSLWLMGFNDGRDEENGNESEDFEIVFNKKFN